MSKKKIDQIYSIVYCVGYKPVPTAFHDQHEDTCLHHNVFIKKYDAESFLMKLRYEFEKTQFIANLVHYDIQQLNAEEREKLENDDNQVSYIDRMEQYRAKRWMFHMDRHPHYIPLTDRSDIYIIRELKLYQ